MTPSCPVCGRATGDFDRAVVLARHEVDYRRCLSCGLVFLPSPSWLGDAYAEAISTADTGLLRRCRVLATVTSALLRAEGLRDGDCLDWAGGYGTLTRMMRDRGARFWHSDPYCENLFAREYVDPGDVRYDLVTAFEVVEHLPDPVTALAPVAGRTDRLFFTTLLLPDPAPPVADWWYYGTGSGQHVMFHTRRSLEELGRRLGLALTSNGDNLHLFHRTTPRLGTRLLLSQPLAGVKRAAADLARRRRGEVAA